MPTNVLTAKSAWVLFSLAVGPAHNVGPPGVQTPTSDFTAYVAYSWPSREECEATIRSLPHDGTLRVCVETKP